jgi:5-methyltetrahydropteroyltriglutamate--homocysteine methyltransferase
VPLSLLRLLPDKQLMIGAIQVTGDRVETPEEVAATLRAAMQYVDSERILPCTNCGMAPIAYDVALAKLKALGAGAALVRRSL